jgi:5-methylcytosine-specific restriction endonuclease McrA
VISERQLYRHRSRAGYRIGDTRRIDFLYYVAWLQARRREQVRRREKVACSAESKGALNVRNVLRLVEDQQFCCALTGRPLTPDLAALDHKVPVSRGGEHHIENAQVLHKDVNRAKGVMTNEEFIALCREVVAHASRTALTPSDERSTP